MAKKTARRRSTKPLSSFSGSQRRGGTQKSQAAKVQTSDAFEASCVVGVTLAEMLSWLTSFGTSEGKIGPLWQEKSLPQTEASPGKR